MNFSDILENPHFNNLAAVVRVAFLSKSWRKEYAQVPFWTLVDHFQEVTPLTVQWDKSAVAIAFTDLITAIAGADGRLRMSYSEQDLAWFLSVLDSEHHKVIIKMLQAWYSAPDELLTPQEVADATGTHESGWRNKAAAGEIPGSFKKGKTWLLPRSVLRSRGIDI